MISQLLARRLDRSKNSSLSVLKTSLLQTDRSLEDTPTNKIVTPLLKHSSGSQMSEYAVEDSFQFLKKLGNGSSSVVWKCRRYSDNKYFAVKECLRSAYDSEVVGVAYREFCLLKSLSHPNILEIEDFVVSTVSRKAFIIVELVEGLTLEEALRERGGQFTENETRNIIKQLLNAILYLHSKQICHRDVKPHNIMVRPCGKIDQYSVASVKLIDFNIAIEFKTLPIGLGDIIEQRTFKGSKASAHEASPMQDTGMFTPTGTKGYMAPEVDMQGCSQDFLDVYRRDLFANDLMYSEKIDIWSAGQVMQFIAPIKSELSRRGQAFLEELKQSDPCKRPAAMQCLLHKWIRPTDSVHSSNRRRSYTKSYTFAVQRQRKKHATACLAAEILTGGLQNLKERNGNIDSTFNLFFHIKANEC